MLVMTVDYILKKKIKKTVIVFYGLLKETERMKNEKLELLIETNQNCYLGEMF